ncbi:alpha/beta hydrolase [Actinomadura darangshiensis]|uniref:Alpha/beta hydrolase n=1 Tax=Actinomadura darangshiensis TaxID=705336 RepID=A0A4R5C207_9ACTN|nr:alpha/beta hydrolase [Actinomadura darangshiensis]TDD92559.1 alpha/beta hydrolase [Actinomadura darangshiensis]
MAGGVNVTIWDETGGTGPRAILVHGSTSWGDDPALGFAAQRPLAAGFRVLAMDRRGNGGSGETGSAEYAGDYLADADDIADLMGDGAHLAGHSYGAVGVMLAAVRRPGAVLSLALIEPGCYQAAAEEPAVAAALRANRENTAKLPADLPAEAALRAATDSVGLPPLEPTPRRLRGAHTAMRERLCWEAPIPVAALAEAAWPKLVISGTWETAPALYRERGGEPLMACGRVTAQRIGARHLRVRGAAHYPHVERPEAVNAALAGLWGA